MPDEDIQVSVGALHKTVADLFTPKAWLYWLDLSWHGALGWSALFMSLGEPGGSIGWSIWTLVAIMALYRAVIFTHELVHIRKDRLPGFQTAWNLICGVPLLVPSYMYDGVHQEHHFRSRYGTEQDGEYLPFGRPPRWRIVLYMATHLLLPPLAVIRFGVLAPLSLVSATWRRTLQERASSLSIDPGYRRSVPDSVPAAWARQEFACTAFVWVVVGLVIAGIVPAYALLQYYIVVVGILTFNGVRTLAAHRYRNPGGSLTFQQQLADSINVTGGGIATVLLAPVGLRYHALHHLFPTLPYHNLGAAHRRLIEKLPPGSTYHATLRGSMLEALRELWRSAAPANESTEMELPPAS